MTQTIPLLIATVIHDTLIVVRANTAALKLFRATEQQIVGARLIDLVADDEDMRYLVSIRMQFARDGKHIPPTVDYVLRRLDGSRFMASMTTIPLDNGEWETKIKPTSEY